MKITSENERDTLFIGERYAEKLKGGEIILLEGELGAGKTVFTKGIARGLGVTRNVLSPTFTIMNEYDGTELKLCHYDAYRLSSGDEAEEAGLTEFFGRKDCVCVVEWAQNIASALENLDTVTITVKYLDENQREIDLN